MFLDTMTREEMVRDLVADDDLVSRKMNVLSSEFSKICIKKKQFPIGRWYPYHTTAGRNNDFLLFFYAEKRSDWNRPCKMYVALYRTADGIGAITITGTPKKKHYQFITPHFISRWAERTGFGADKSHVEAIKAYMDSHIFDVPSVSDIDECKLISEKSRYRNPDKKTSCCVMHDGVVISVRTAHNIDVLTTFLSFDILKEGQPEAVEEIIRKNELWKMIFKLTANRFWVTG